MKNQVNLTEKQKSQKNVQQLVYVLKCIELSSAAADNNVVFENDKEKVVFFLETFNKEFNFDYNKKRTPNLQERIANYLQGLPSCFAVDFENAKNLDILRAWKVVNDKTTPRKIDNFLSNWFSILSLRILQLAAKLNINTNYLI